MTFSYKMNLTADYLRSILRYVPETGVFTWIKSKGAARAGKEAGCFSPETGRQIRINGELYLGHRLAWLYMTGEWPKGEIDHKDCNRGNNSWDNLREASHAENNHNVGPYRNNKLGLKGVHELPGSKKRYCARITVNRKAYQLGTYDTPEEAHQAYAAAANDLHGEFARVSR